ncbi:DedA family protein [Parafrigoribacterium soli]|uniref:DedA family protein n=1 Tax=Parafrigoribacterium soli TaxID=3144663 RepID=UPI0032ED0B2E
MNDALNWILGVVHEVDPVVRILLAAVGIFCETSILIGLIVPGDTIVIVAATATTNWLEYAALLIAVIIGALGGETVGFALGHYFGPKIRSSWLGRRIGETHWVRAENYLDRRGGIAVFISRFLPVLHSLIPLTVGMSTMRYRKFMAWTAPACVVWALAYVSVGWAAADSYRHLSQQLHFAGYVFVGVVVVFLILVVLVKKLIARSQARHMLYPGDGDANTIDAPYVED